MSHTTDSSQNSADDKPSIGDYVSIHASANIGDGVVIGSYSAIHADVEIAPGVVVGERVTIKSGAIISSDVIIEDGCLIASNVMVRNGARLRPGAVLHSDVPNNAVVAGNPASIVDYITSHHMEATPPIMIDSSGIKERKPLLTEQCFLEPVPNFIDVRGSLTALENGNGAPFVPKRVFLVYDVGSQHVRGEHAHHKCGQFLVAINGSLSVMIDDGETREEIRLSDKSVGLYLAPGTWGVQYKFSTDCILMVLASHPYENADYIRNYDEFLKLKSS